MKRHSQTINTLAASRKEEREREKERERERERESGKQRGNRTVATKALNIHTGRPPHIGYRYS